MQAKTLQLKHYIESGLPSVDDFLLVETTLPKPNNGQVRVKNQWMSVDPYMRGRMINRTSYIPPFELNKPMQGGAIGVVEASMNADFKKGDVVVSMYGWQAAFVANGNELQKIEDPVQPLSYYLGVLGMPGLTAYAGLLEIGKPNASETVFVSAASGAVGSLVCQIAKLQGCRVIGSAGSDAKAAWLLDIGAVDEVINYKTCGDITKKLLKKAPKGIDVYFDNVGGEHLQAALTAMNPYGRIVMCGAISGYNAREPQPGPTNLMQVIGKRLTLQGFIVSDFEKIKPQFYSDMTKWLADKKIQVEETIVDGIEKSPDAFINLFNGINRGKMIVKLD